MISKKQVVSARYSSSKSPEGTQRTHIYCYLTTQHAVLPIIYAGCGCRGMKDSLSLTVLYKDILLFLQNVLKLYNN